jgi:hypothetical protein
MHACYIQKRESWLHHLDGLNCLKTALLSTISMRTYGSDKTCKPSCIYDRMHETKALVSVYWCFFVVKDICSIVRYALTTLFHQGSSLKSVCFQRHSPYRCRCKSFAPIYSLFFIIKCAVLGSAQDASANARHEKRELAASFWRAELLENCFIEYNIAPFKIIIFVSLPLLGKQEFQKGSGRQAQSTEVTKKWCHMHKRQNPVLTHFCVTSVTRQTRH